jgi:hypothetical protein
MSLREDADQAICRHVAKLGFSVVQRDVRTLRECGVIEVMGDRRDRRGGRSKVAQYVPGTAEVVAAVQVAKTDPTYRRKLYRAVLIAWVRGALIGTPGLRWAYRKHFEHEQKAAINVLKGKRVEDDEEVTIGPSADRALAGAMLGRVTGSEGIGSLERATGPVVHDAAWKSAHPDLLLALGDGHSVGLAQQRSDGTWQVRPLGNSVIEALELAPLARIARTASREELEAARDEVRTSMRSRGFDPSDLVVATNAPRHVQYWREAVGAGWWKSRLRPNRRNM